jgi:hypothetical protein
LLTAGTIFAQDTGKITGTIQTRNHEALPGANIYIEGTKLGAAADAEGKYTIENVPPGKYMVVAQMIGFEKVIVEDVTVRVNKKTKLDFRLSETTLDLGEATVIGERDFAIPSANMYKLSGIVLDEETGKGIPEARVIISTSGRGTLGTETDEKGEFTFTIRGVLDIRVKKDGYESWMDTEVPVNKAGKKITVKLKRQMPVHTKVFAISYKDPREIRELIGPLVFDDGSASHTISDNPALGTLTVRARADILKQIEELIAQYDIPPNQIRLDVQLIAANGGETAKQSFPRELSPIKKKLTDLFKYKQYKLVGSGNALVFENESCQMSISGAAYRVAIRQIDFLLNAQVIKLSGFELQGNQARLSTTLNVKNGDTVIIGKTSTDNPNEALITVVKAEVIN